MSQRPASDTPRARASLLGRAAVSPSVFAVLALLWCLDLGVGSLVAYRRPDLFGSMDAYPFALWLRTVGSRALPHSLWVWLLAGLTWLMVGSLALCTANWFLRRRGRLAGMGEVLVHLGFLLVFAGFVTGSVLGARSQGVRVPPGRTVAVPGQGVSLRLEELETARSPDGRPLDTISRVIVLRDGREIGRGTVRLNHPLIRGPLVIYPRGSTTLVSGAEIFVPGMGTLSLRDDRPVPLDGHRVLELWGVLQDDERRGPYAGPGLFITVRGPGGGTTAWAYLAPVPAWSQAVLDGLPVSLRQLTWTTAGIYDVHRDPGVWLVLAGAAFILLGSCWAVAGYLRAGSTTPGPARPVSRPVGPPCWTSIDTILLDMDGTLLDRSFDDHFWEEFVPRRWAEARGLSPQQARDELRARYRAEEGTLNWYDVDFWSEELGLDIMALKRQVEHLVAVHPHVIDFLERVRGMGRRVVLVTNAHGKTLGFKMDRTRLAGHFDALVTSHELGAPKEEPAFWERLQERLGYDPRRTLLADDNVAVLEAAGASGIRWLVHMARPSSALPTRRARNYFSVAAFDEIMPTKSSSP